MNKKGKVNIFLGTDSTDRVGNSVLEKFSKEVTVDDKPPKLLKLVIKNIGGAQQAFGNFTKTGDKLLVEAAIEDDSLASVTADFSRFIFDAKDVSADTCIKTGAKTFVCSWTTTGIDIEGFIDDFIRFEFTDIAGNTLNVKEPHTVFGLIEETTPDFWESEVKCSPSLLDRETMSLIEQRAFCQVTLKPKSLINKIGTFEDLTTLSISLGECKGNLGTVESFEVINNQRGSTEPFIKVNFRKQDLKTDEINFLCPLNIISKQGNKITPIPEIENIDFGFKFYNLPLGELSDSVQGKIDDAIDDSGGILKITTSLKKLFFYASRICQIVNLGARIVGFFKVIGNILVSMEITTQSVPGVGQGMTLQRISHDLSTENLRELTIQSWGKFNKFCDFVNCKLAFEEDGKPIFKLGGAGPVLAKWQKGGKSFINNALGGDLVGELTGDLKTGKRPIESYMNPKDSLVVATLTACIPGIIHGLDKVRQIECMYADCLQTGVGKQGLPVFACEDQKRYATCKYVWGEVFNIIPFTAIFNYYINLIKNTLSNPFVLIGILPGHLCKPTITPATPTAYNTCAALKIFSFIGETAQEITSIIDEGAFKIRNDYCSRLESN